MHTLRKTVYSFAAVCFLVMWSSLGFCDDSAYYCNESFDVFREIEYFSKLSLYIDDYSFESGDAAYLRLSYPKNTEPLSPKIPSKELKHHFDNEVNRLFAMLNMPVHNTFEGADKRRSEWFNKQLSSGKTNISYNEFEALEEAMVGRPGEQQRGSAYGDTTTDNTVASSPADSTTTGKKMASFTNDNGETEEGEVLSQDTQSVTLKTSKGTKKVDIAQAMVDETVEQLKSNIIKLADFGKDK